MGVERKSRQQNRRKDRKGRRDNMKNNSVFAYVMHKSSTVLDRLAQVALAKGSL